MKTILKILKNKIIKNGEGWGADVGEECKGGRGSSHFVIPLCNSSPPPHPPPPPTHTHTHTLRPYLPRPQPVSKPLRSTMVGRDVDLCAFTNISSAIRGAKETRGERRESKHAASPGAEAVCCISSRLLLSGGPSLVGITCSSSHTAWCRLVHALLFLFLSLLGEGAKIA